MGRTVGLLSLFVVLALSIFLFEWQNVWEFNADRVQLLRLIFYGCAFAALVAALAGPLTWLPPAILAAAFVVTAFLSRAEVEFRSVVVSGFFVVATLVSSALIRPPVIRSRR